MKHISRLKLMLDKLEGYIPDWQKGNTAISTALVGWHIEHTALTTARIIEAIKNSDPDTYKWKFNLARSFVFLINTIPRGKGKAPKSVLPGEISTQSIHHELQIARVSIDELSVLTCRHHFDHPYFGKLALKDAAKFVHMHAAHHLKIVQDILK